jgi:hypothetical protein
MGPAFQKSQLSILPLLSTFYLLRTWWRSNEFRINDLGKEGFSRISLLK